ncbi:Hypothetical predicted protein [Paramuricea clavata]|uniref:Uncharacterized protein n=1 Tax=Paramuricea clavata TaxID=317549 RepID=A0A7D9LVU6_PARCT|nr:Hypothetical predicted protein [Paramuricea clavata]
MFPVEMELLRRLKSNPTKREDVKDRKASLKRNSALCRLDPFIDKEGLVRVGGRIKRADVPFHVKHSAILPRKGHITSLIIQHYHQRVKHQGRGITLNEIREDGIWIIGATSAVAHHIAKCVTCRKLRVTVKLIVADPLLNERGKRSRVATILERPIQKLVVLLKVEDTENVEE